MSTPSRERSLALLAFRAGRFGQAIEVCRRAIERTQRQGDDECWRLRIVLSRCLSESGDFAGAIELLESVEFGEGVSVETRARILNQKAFCLSRGGKFAAARQALDQASALTSPDSSQELRGEIEMNRCTLFFYLAEYDEVETCARAALQIGEEEKLPFTEANGCSGIGKSYMYRDRQAEAIPWYERALAICEKEGATFYADAMRSELGCCHLAVKEYEKAEGYFARALKTSRESGALASLHIDLANMGCVHLGRREFAPAIAHFQEALEIARKLGDSISVSKWLGNLALTYTRMGNPMLAKGFQLEAARVSEQVAAARAAAK